MNWLRLALNRRASATLSSSRHICRPHPQGRQAGGPAGRAGEQVRAGHQSPDRQDARPRSAADAARTRRRGDRMMGCRGYDFRERHPTSRRGASFLPIVPVYPQGHQGGTSLPRRGRVLPAIRPEEREARTLMSPRVVIGTRPRPTLSGVSIHR